MIFQEAPNYRSFNKPMELSPERAKEKLEQEVNNIEKLPGKTPAIPDAHIRSGSFEQYLAHKGITEDNGLHKSNMPAKDLKPTQPLNYNRILSGETTTKPVIVIYDPNQNTYKIIDGHTKWGKIRLLDFQFPERAEDLGGHQVDTWVLKGNFNKIYSILRDFEGYAKNNMLAKPDYSKTPDQEKQTHVGIQQAGDEFWGTMEEPTTPQPIVSQPQKRSFIAPKIEMPIKRNFVTPKGEMPIKSFREWLAIKS